MKQLHASRLDVSLDIEGSPIHLGRLAWSRDDRVAAFELSKNAVGARPDISPFQLRPSSGVVMARRTPFDGLHGVFADSLPDGWGRLLLDRHLLRNGADPSILTPVDRLAIVASRGMGALVYAPAIDVDAGHSESAEDLDWFAEQAEAVLSGHSDAGISRLLEASGGSAGARPKIMALRNIHTGRYEPDSGATARVDHDHWIIKLKHRRDGVAIGRIEHAYAAMARAAGIDFPQTDLVEDRNGEAHFAVRRFDRTKKGRLHVHTLAGLVHANFRIPSLDYSELLKATRVMTKSQDQVEEAFRRMVFNVLASNRDDHAKNHAFIMTRGGEWSLSPAYDVTPSTGPGGEHNMTIAGEGMKPTHMHVMKIADTSGISSDRASIIVGEVAEAISRWPTYAKESGIGKAEAAAIAKLLSTRNTIQKNKTPPARTSRKRPSKSREIGD